MNRPMLFTNKAQLFKTYFLLLRIALCVSGVFALSMLAEGFEIFILSAIIGSLVFLGFQFYLSIVAEKLLKKGNYIGLLLGLVLSLTLLFSLFFPIALFGFYALLNKDFRSQQLSVDVPAWLKDGFIILDDLVLKVRGELARKS